MIYFFSALFFSSLIVITFKLIDHFKLHLLTIVFVNYAAAFALGWVATKSFFSQHQIMQLPWFPYAIVGGILFIVTFILIGLSTRYAGLAITSVAGKMSVVIPVLMGFFILAENAAAMKLVGITLALIAFYLTFASRTPQNSKASSRTIFPLLLFFSTGIGDALIKYAQVKSIGTHFLPFLTVIFCICLLLSIVLMTAQNGWQKTYWNWQNLLTGIALGSFNWLSTIFLLKAMQSMEASVIFPAFNAGILAIASTAGVFLFREKLKPINWVGVFLAIVATLMVASAH